MVNNINILYNKRYVKMFNSYLPVPSASHKLKFGQFFEYHMTKQNTSQQSNQQEIFWISIGSASNLSSKNRSMLDKKDEQQFPQFLQIIRTNFPNIKMNIILIDDAMENVPYCVDKQIKNKWEKDKSYDNIYYSHDTNVYSFKENISYVTHRSPKFFNATEQLRSIHNYCIQKNHLFFAHDFSGDDISKLAEYFDLELHGKKKNIMYDIGVRDVQSCTINMVQSKNTPICVINKNKYEIFNPYNLSSKVLNHYLTSQPNQNIPTTDIDYDPMEVDDGQCNDVKLIHVTPNMIEQIRIRITNEINVFLNNEFTKYRQARINNSDLSSVNVNLTQKISDISIMIYDKPDILSNMVINTINSTRDPYKWLELIRAQIKTIKY